MYEVRFRVALNTQELLTESISSFHHLKRRLKLLWKIYPYHNEQGKTKRSFQNPMENVIKQQ
jgi:hypothetical protein